VDDGRWAGSVLQRRAGGVAANTSNPSPSPGAEGRRPMSRGAAPSRGGQVLRSCTDIRGKGERRGEIRAERHEWSPARSATGCSLTSSGERRAEQGFIKVRGLGSRGRACAARHRRASPRPHTQPRSAPARAVGTRRYPSAVPDLHPPSSACLSVRASPGRSLTCMSLSPWRVTTKTTVTESKCRFAPSPHVAATGASSSVLVPVLVCDRAEDS
jgi:hypothetical protein